MRFRMRRASGRLRCRMGSGTRVAELGHLVLSQVGVSPTPYIRDLTEDEGAKLRDAIDDGLTVEGDLRRERSQDIKRLQEIGCYPGLRHQRGLPVDRKS